MGNPVEMIEQSWKMLDIVEADLKRYPDGVPGFPNAHAVAAQLRAQIKELQRTHRAKLPSDQFRTDKHQLRQEDAQWIEDGGWSGKR
jgi:hypothetical protein